MSLKIIKAGINPSNDVFKKHQTRIAKQTLKYSDVGASIMGGMTKQEAREFLRSQGYSVKKIEELERNPRRHRKSKIKTRSRRKKKIACRKPKRKMKRIKKRKVIRARKNPPHKTIIVGFTSHHREPRGKRYYYTGDGFNRLRSRAKVFAGDGARFEAKRILPVLPKEIYGITVEKA